MLNPRLSPSRFLFLGAHLHAMPMLTKNCTEITSVVWEVSLDYKKCGQKHGKTGSFLHLLTYKKQFVCLGYEHKMEKTTLNTKIVHKKLLKSFQSLKCSYNMWIEGQIRQTAIYPKVSSIR